MSMPLSAFSNIFMASRQRARMQSERVETADEVPEEEVVVVVNSDAPSSPTRRRSSSSNRTITTTEQAAPRPPIIISDPETALESVALHDSDEEDDGEEAGLDGSSSSADRGGVRAEGFTPFAPRTMSLAELQEERELTRRRSSACLLLSAFVLFRLWVLAVQEGDFGLLLLCLVGTSWTVRWIGHNREREEELDRRIANYIENNESGTAEVDRNELRMLSFQAQLALAIMESQRQMMQGGFGHPDGEQQAQGVSEDARAQWDRFSYDESAAASETPDAAGGKPKSKGGYGSVSQKDKDLANEEPHCSICLSEYEQGDAVVRLPCGHEYHDECISSWTSNHVKCPLCNFDLESVVGDASTEASIVNNSSHVADNSIV